MIASLRYFEKNDIILVTVLKYCKLSRLGTVMRGNGQYLQHSLEFCLIGVMNDYKSILNHVIVPNLIFANSQDMMQSKKPDCMYALIEKIVGPCAFNVELFGRVHNLRRNWITLGNEI